MGWQVLPSKTPWRSQHIQWRQKEQNSLQASGGIEKLSCLLQNICNMLLAQSKWVRCFPQEPLHPGWAGGGGAGRWLLGMPFCPENWEWKERAPEHSWSLNDRLIAPLHPQARRVLRELSHPGRLPAPALSLLSRAERRLPSRLCGLDPASGYRSMVR